MIVDCHTHIDFDLEPPEVAEHVAAAEMVDACIVLGCPKAQREAANQKLGKFVKVHSDKMLGFAVLDPTKDSFKETVLTQLREELGLQGFVLYCSAWGFHPTHSDAMRFYGSVQEMGVPVFFHNGDLDISSRGILAYAQPYLLDEVARTYPDLKIIIGSMGIPFVEQTIAVLARHENVFADLTIRPRNIWQTYNIVVSAHEQGVMDKLLFGSGYPIATPGACIETLLGFNTLMADTNLPTVPRGSIRSVVERNSLELLGMDFSKIKSREIRTKTEPQDRHKQKQKD